MAWRHPTKSDLESKLTSYVAMTEEATALCEFVNTTETPGLDVAAVDERLRAIKALRQELPK